MASLLGSWKQNAAHWQVQVQTAGVTEGAVLSWWQGGAAAGQHRCEAEKDTAMLPLSGSFSFAGFSLILMSNLAKQMRATAPPEKLASILMDFRGLPFDYLTLLLEGEIFFGDTGII